VAPTTPAFADRIRNVNYPAWRVALSAVSGGARRTALAGQRSPGGRRGKITVSKRRVRRATLTRGAVATDMGVEPVTHGAETSG